MFNRLSRLLAMVLVIPLLIAACTANPTAISTGSGSVPVAQNTQVPVGEGGEGGAEAALVTYSDAKQGFLIGHPGTWTQDKGFANGVKFVGGDGQMTIEFITPTVSTDVMSYAKNDVATVTAAYPGFKQVGLAVSSEVRNAVVLGFQANGTSTVTGKAFTAHDERYYMPLKDGRIAILTVIGPDNQYDREGVRDIALTFKLSK